METTDISTIITNSKKIFFIGIGGISMSSLAMISKCRGFQVAGSDKTCTNLTLKLEKNGIKVSYNHDIENIKGYELIVYNAAINENNPELKAAREQKIPCIYRADFLGYIMSNYKNRIGISGMHGKSTTTSMVSHIFLEADFDPTIVNGAEMSEIDGAYKVGSDKYFIFEGCEYKDSFLSFFPSVAIILNIDMDHVDYFHSIEQIITSFSKYMAIADTCIVNWDCDNVRLASKNYKGKLIKYGIKDENTNYDYTAKNLVYNKGLAIFDIYYNQELLCNVQLSVPGEHNVLNALASAASANVFGVPPLAISKGLSNFKGAKRRLENKGSYNGITIFDDYAHHPSEIKTTLDGVRKLGYEKIWCIYQPHTYSRTAELFNDFVNSFSAADTVIFSDIYSAREDNTYNISSSDLAEKIDNAIYIKSFQEIADYIKLNAKTGDLVLTMGAGDIHKVGLLLK